MMLSEQAYDPLVHDAPSIQVFRLIIPQLHIQAPMGVEA